MSPDFRPAALVGLSAILTACGSSSHKSPNPPQSLTPDALGNTVDAVVCGAIDPSAHDGLCTEADLPVPPGLAVTFNCKGDPFATVLTGEGGRTTAIVIPASCREALAIGVMYQKPVLVMDGKPVQTCAQVTIESNPPEHTVHIELFPCNQGPNSLSFNHRMPRQGLLGYAPGVSKPPFSRRIGKQNWSQSG